MSRVQPYLPWIDVLRALAVLLAVLCHVVPGVSGPAFPQGSYGVDLFFVISGFLITLILLRRRMQIPPHSRLREIRDFFARRVLRLWPAYYFCLLSFLGLWLLYDHAGQWEPSRRPEHLGWIALQGTNILQFMDGLHIPLFDHFWSLGVEEQFYLFWPFLLFFVPQKRLLPVLLLVFAAGCCAQLFFPSDHSRLFDGAPGDARLLPAGNFHTIAAGALLAWLVHARRARFDRIAAWLLPAGLAALAGFVVIECLSPPVVITGWDIPQRLLLAAGCAGLTGTAFAAGTGRFPRLLQPLAGLGKISYGVYLYHKIVPYLLMPVLLKLHIATGVSGAVLICMIISIVWAALSYAYIEQPVQRLRKYVGGETPEVGEEKKGGADSALRPFRPNAVSKSSMSAAMPVVKKEEREKGTHHPRP